MTVSGRNKERAEDLVGRGEDVIVDTVPGQILTAVERYYNHRGYRLRRFTLVGRETYEAVFVR